MMMMMIFGIFMISYLINYSKINVRSDIIVYLGVKY